MLRAGRVLLMASLLTTAFSSPAQQITSQPVRSLLVNVLDRNGNAIRDLTKDNFRVKVNGHPASVLDASYSLSPGRIVVLLDMSESMAGEKGDKSKWQIAKDAVTDLVTMTPTGVPIALVAFSDHVSTTIEFAHGRPAIAEWLNQGPSQREKLKGRTALFDAALAALKLMEPASPGDVIYAVTDGGDNGSNISEVDMKEMLLQSETRLFVFLFVEPLPTKEERSGGDSVLNLARDTGGNVFGNSSHSSDLGPSFSSWDVMYDRDGRTRDKIRLYTQALNTQVNGFYTLRVAVPFSRKQSKIKLEIVKETGKAWKDVTFTFPRLLPGHQ